MDLLICECYAQKSARYVSYNAYILTVTTATADATITIAMIITAIVVKVRINVGESMTEIKQ